VDCREHLARTSTPTTRPIRKFDETFELNLFYSYDAGMRIKTRQYIQELQEAVKHGAIELNSREFRNRRELDQFIDRHFGFE